MTGSQSVRTSIVTLAVCMGMGTVAHAAYVARFGGRFETSRRTSAPIESDIPADWRTTVTAAIKDSAALAKVVAFVTYTGVVTSDDRSAIGGYGTIEDIDVVGTNGLLVIFTATKLRDLASNYRGNRIADVQLVTDVGMKSNKP